MRYTRVSCGAVLRQDCHSVQNEQVTSELLLILVFMSTQLFGSVFFSHFIIEILGLPGPFRGIVEETPNTTEHGRPSVMLEKYASATKMQPQSSGSLRSNAGIEKGKEIAARLNIHRIHSQLRGLDSTG